MGFRRVDGPHADRPDSGQVTNLTYVTPEYFDALRIRLLRGRLFTAADKADSQGGVIVNERFVREYLQDQDPVGSHIGSGGAKRGIVGVIRDVPVSRGFCTPSP